MLWWGLGVVAVITSILWGSGPPALRSARGTAPSGTSSWACSSSRCRCSWHTWWRIGPSPPWH